MTHMYDKSIDALRMKIRNFSVQKEIRYTIVKDHFDFLQTEIEIRIESLKLDLDRIASKTKQNLGKNIGQLVDRLEIRKGPQENQSKSLQTFHIGKLRDNYLSFSRLHANQFEIHCLDETIACMPVHICQTNSKHLAISSENSIYLFDTKFVFVKKLRSTTDYRVFKNLKIICSDLLDNVFICDHAGRFACIVDIKFDQTKTELGHGRIGRCEQFSLIEDACFYNGHIFMLDSSRKCVKQFEPNGNFVRNYFLLKNNLHETDGHMSDAYLIDYPLKMCILENSKKMAIMADYGQTVYIYDFNQHLIQTISHVDLCCFCYFKTFLVMHASDGSLYFYADGKSGAELTLYDHTVKEGLKEISNWIMGVDERLLLLLPYSNSIACIRM